MKNEFPFGDFDLRTFMGEFRLPAMDSNKLVEAQRRNLEAIQHANQAAVSHMQAIMRRQAEMMQEAMKDASGAMKDVMGAGSPEEGARRQSEVAQRAMETALANVREIAEMTAKSNRDIFDLINSRMMAGVEEARGMGAGKPAGGAADAGKPASPGAAGEAAPKK